jgi:YfiH family protein
LLITVHTADCLPVFIAERNGHEVGLAHAGWRGLLGGVIESTLSKFASAREDLCVWLGPAIGPTVFEVGTDVRAPFIAHDPQHARAFVPHPQVAGEARWLCDIYTLARQRLSAAGITQISGGSFCTVTDERFFSYRRDRVTGRMLSGLYIAP